MPASGGTLCFPSPAERQDSRVKPAQMGRRDCANSGHSPTTWQQAGLDPERSFETNLDMYLR